jgi:tRNA-dihydrouridine synthase A
MIDVTDRHFRMLLRIISPGACPQLWSEMTWDRAILYNAPAEPEFSGKPGCSGGLESIIGFSPGERPLVLQLGGAEPQSLARSARLAEAAGYDEINLNCGCPAQTKGRSRNCFGARLMFEPERVAECCAAILAAVRLPVSVKIRLGVNECDSYAQLTAFVRIVAGAGVRHFIVHARKAILGLDPTKNRSVPPLRHEWVFALLDDFPDLRFHINGGVTSLQQAAALLRAGVHGVMIGRRASTDPYMFSLTREALFYAFAEAEQQENHTQQQHNDAGWGGASRGNCSPAIRKPCPSCGSGPPRTRREVLTAYSAYCSLAQASNWANARPERTARALLTPVSALFHNTTAARVWKAGIMAACADTARLQSQPVAARIQECVDALIASPGAVGESALTLLDTRPSFSPGPLPAEQHPPLRPCRVGHHERAGGADERRPREGKTKPAGRCGTVDAGGRQTGDANGDAGGRPTGVGREPFCCSGGTTEPTDECPGLEGRAGCGVQGEGQATCQGRQASLIPSACSLRPVILCACVAALVLAAAARVRQR